MKVLDLGCAHAHVFEGWFASEEDFQAQLGRGLLECPVCGDQRIAKRLSAPRLNLKSSRSQAEHTVVPAETESPADPQFIPVEMQARLLNLVREVIAKTEDVGGGFADEARRMHCGETEQRSIRGTATVEDAMALVDEGIDVLALPDLDLFKQTLQ